MLRTAGPDTNTSSAPKTRSSNRRSRDHVVGCETGEHNKKARKRRKKLHTSTSSLANDAVGGQKGGNPLLKLEKWMSREYDYVQRQVGFCAQWCLDNLCKHIINDALAKQGMQSKWYSQLCSNLCEYFAEIWKSAQNFAFSFFSSWNSELEMIFCGTIWELGYQFRPFEIVSKSTHGIFSISDILCLKFLVTHEFLSTILRWWEDQFMLE